MKFLCQGKNLLQLIVNEGLCANPLSWSLSHPACDRACGLGHVTASRRFCFSFLKWK